MAGYTQDLAKQFESLQVGSSHNKLHTHLDPENVLVNILIYILKETKVPISLSFLNVTFKSLCLPWIISENFLLKKHDVFALSILGNDLKIFLRKTNNIFQRTEDGLNIISIINKDLTLISRFQDMLQNATSFDEFCQKHSSNKYKVNLAFVIRNSHALRLSLMNGITYIDSNKNGFHSELKEDEIWSCLRNDGFETIFVKCLKGLLEKFSVPVQLGNLQSCFNYGGWVIDKGFLKTHSDIFQGDGIRGITLNKNVFENKSSSCYNEVPIRKNMFENNSMSSYKVVPVRNNTVENKNLSSYNEFPMKNDTETNLKSYLQKSLVDFALQHNSSILVLGSSNQQPPLIVEALGSDNKEKRLTAICLIRDHLNKEIEKELTKTRK
ncbi:uncharacterized protein LOC105843867 [Hydra vulgaris]|uniref:uncharacterized protein LOC105843867 n=1 Tax=Hydra vulgaris TaxID=6087 RepID=UPI0006412972|nr:uncharacterized protein LOC105843867 [Hydra vulgaris]